MNYVMVRADATRIPLPDQSVDLVLGSPPYVDARLYLEDGVDLGISRGVHEWVEWMLAVTTEALRVSRGAVVWVAAGVTRDRNYWPACEGLMWEWFRRGGHAYRPCYWHRVGIPGSGGDQWFRADVEYVMAFKRPGKLPWTDNTSMGHAPKYKPGGVPSHRLADGTRANLVRMASEGKTLVSVTRRKVGSGEREKAEYYIPPDLANPGNVIKTNAGGGHTGPAMALDGNEAPYPEALAEFFVKSLCPPGGTVLDTFSGSGTTAAAAAKNERAGIGMDLRQSQCRLGLRRVAAGLRPVSKFDTPAIKPLPGQQSLFDREAS